jgi:hypothetical protein
VLFVSDERDSPDSTALANFVDEPVRVRFYIAAAAHGGRPAHGMDLLETNEQAVEEILIWLDETLR